MDKIIRKDVYDNSPKCAGNLIEEKVPIVSEKSTIADVEELLLEKASEFHSIIYIYVVDSENKLKGALSVREVFQSPKTTKVSDILPKECITVRENLHQEQVALISIKHNLKSVPVVDDRNHLLGVVPSDVILRVLDSEYTENILRFGGIVHIPAFDDVFHLSLIKSLKHRLPWLILGLIGGIFASGIINNFEEILSKNIILAAFIPLIVYMADAVGTQMEAFIIRDLAVNPDLKFIKYFLRQILIVFFIALITSVLLYLGCVYIYKDVQLAITVSLALFFAVVSAVVSGLVIPFVFSKLRMDPANASGPVATIIQDITSIFVYFTIASFLLG